MRLDSTLENTPVVVSGFSKWQFALSEGIDLIEFEDLQERKKYLGFGMD